MRCMLDTVMFLLLLVAAFDVSGYPDGAPKNRKLCKTLRPRHHGTQAQTSTAPYDVIAEKSKIPVGGSVKVTISAKSGSSYKGFVMQARPKMIENVEYIKPIGTFTILDTKNSKTLDCLSATKNTVTHTNPNLKTSTNFTWTPPSKYKGPVYFRASFVKDFSTYWLNVSSKIVVGDSDVEDPFWTDRESQEAFEYENDAMFSIPDVYEECGYTKACFGLPGGCVFERSCDTLMTVKDLNSKYEFEMVGKDSQYVAVSLSESGALDVSSVIKCALTDYDPVNIRQSKYYEYEGVESPRVTNGNLDLVNSSYIDGAVYCKFERDEIVLFNNVEYDLRNKQYFVLLAAGNLPENNQHNFDMDNVQFHASKQKTFLSDVSGFSTTEKPKEKTNLLRGVLKLFLDYFDYFMLLD